MIIKEKFKPLAKKMILPSYCRLRYGSVGQYIAQARLIEGWTTPDELITLAKISQDLPHNAKIVEIGSFLGRSSVIMSGSRKIKGSGILHCIDPFDASGEEHSVQIYKDIEQKSVLTLRSRFDRHMSQCGLDDWVKVHIGTAESVAVDWTEAIDMLFLDGDQSPAGVRSAYDLWSPFLKPGGVIAIHNSGDRVYDSDHSGHRKLVLEVIHEPEYTDIFCVSSTTVARKAF
jgi:MMP 1-O-methyltransferase